VLGDSAFKVRDRRQGNTTYPVLVVKIELDGLAKEFLPKVNCGDQ